MGTEQPVLHEGQWRHTPAGKRNASCGQVHTMETRRENPPETEVRQRIPLGTSDSNLDLRATHFDRLLLRRKSDHLRQREPERRSDVAIRPPQNRRWIADPFLERALHSDQLRAAARRDTTD